MVTDAGTASYSVDAKTGFTDFQAITLPPPQVLLPCLLLQWCVSSGLVGTMDIDQLTLTATLTNTSFTA